MPAGGGGGSRSSVAGGGSDVFRGLSPAHRGSVAASHESPAHRGSVAETPGPSHEAEEERQLWKRHLYLLQVGEPLFVVLSGP